MTHVDYRALWTRVQGRLDRLVPDWRRRIEHFGQVRAVEERRQGVAWSDDRVFECLLRAVLSGATDWAKVERVLPEMKSLFLGFQLSRYADVTEAEVRTRFVPWFQQRRAGSPTLATSLVGLAATARRLSDWSTQFGTADSYFTTTITSVGEDPKLAAIALGGASGSRKLRGLGVPLAAETLRNLGFDLAKPDRHVNRACGAFGLTVFRSWDDRAGTKAPVPTESEMLAVMTAMEQMAAFLALPVSFVDNAVWMLCAKQPWGIFLSNSELVHLAAS
jgi:hypothetical protein